MYSTLFSVPAKGVKQYFEGNKINTELVATIDSFVKIYSQKYVVNVNFFKYNYLTGQSVKGI